MTRLRSNFADVLVVLLLVLAEIDVLVSDLDGSTVALLLFPIGWTLPLLARRRAPILAALAVLASLAIEAQVAYDGTERQVVLITAIMAFYTLGRRVERERALLAGAVGVLLGIVLIAADKGPISASGIIFLAVVSVAPFAAGMAVRIRELESEQHADRAERLEHEQGERERAAVAEERARIARELHDMIGHAVSVITVQAGAARLMIDNDPEKARGPLQAIEDTGHETLAEMRRLIGILRDMGEPGLAPQPGLDQLDRLVQGVRDSGLPVELRREGDAATPLPPNVDLAAYRIVQEALTNALKHGGRGVTIVTVQFALHSVALEVNSPAGASVKGNGHGLVGMRERVTQCGGELQVGETAAGGYAVRAVLPL
jgi:signal transduction histidine kinase